MSGSFEDLDVPPTLVSFAVTTENADKIISPEFKGVNHKVVLISPCCGYNALPNGESLKSIYSNVNALMSEGKVLSAYTPCMGGVAEAIFKMCIGNGLGFKYADTFELEQMFSYKYGSFVLELADGADVPENAQLIGETTAENKLAWKENLLAFDELENIYEGKLEPIYPCNIETKEQKLETFSYSAGERAHKNMGKAKPKVLIPVFPGTNCEYDTSKAFEAAGAETEIFIIKI